MIIERLMQLALLGSEWVLYLLIGLSVISISTMVERWVYFFRHRVNVETVRTELVQRFALDDLEGAEGYLSNLRAPQTRIAQVALRWLGGGTDALADAVEAEQARLKPELERGLNFLGTLGNNAPFIGLFGTVLGVIIAFEALGAAGANNDAMGGVMAGIAEALVATGVGLFVALPAVVGYNLIQKKLGDIESQASLLVKEITAHAKAHPHLIEAAQARREQRGSVARLPVGGVAVAQQHDSSRRRAPGSH